MRTIHNALRKGQNHALLDDVSETKELIVGYAIIEVASKAEAVEVAKQFMSIAGDGEGEIFQMLNSPFISCQPVLSPDARAALSLRSSIARGLAELARVPTLGGDEGYYSLQAAITACHARAASASSTDWHQIASLYQRLADLTESPVVELNRAVAVSMAHGPAQGLQIADGLEEALHDYHLLPSVRDDLLAKLGRVDEAIAEFRRAADLTRNARERQLLLARAASLAAPSA